MPDENTTPHACAPGRHSSNFPSVVQLCAPCPGSPASSHRVLTPVLRWQRSDCRHHTQAGTVLPSQQCTPSRTVREGQSGNLNPRVIPKSKLSSRTQRGMNTRKKEENGRERTINNDWFDCRMTCMRENKTRILWFSMGLPVIH